MTTIFGKGQSGQKAYSLPKGDPCWEVYRPPQQFLRTSQLPLPEVAELDIMRHYSGLARQNMGIDTHFYPLGSCTMKYNPRIAEVVAALPNFANTHPLAPDALVQGNLAIAVDLLQFLCQVTGMDGGTLVPNAGAQGEFTGIQMIRAYHQSRGELGQRCDVLIPDNAHGTNPATAVMAGFHTITIPTTSQGDCDLEFLRKAVGPSTAAMMLTNPNTLGLFSPHILEIADLIHSVGGLFYCDGANSNAILECARPGDMGFDVLHLNLHKTFATPHGGGGPGSGPVLCKRHLIPYLPTPRIYLGEDQLWHTLWDAQGSIGRMATFHGNFSIWLRAYLYARLHGHAGLYRIALAAVLNANYLKARLQSSFTIPYPQHCMHEFALRADRFVDCGIRALDIAKRLLDYGFYAPTIYFPLIVKECMLIEPTETESKATLDVFVDALEAICREAQEEPDTVRLAPHHQSVKRLDEVSAARFPHLKEEIVCTGCS